VLFTQYIHSGPECSDHVCSASHLHTPTVPTSVRNVRISDRLKQRLLLSLRRPGPGCGLCLELNKPCNSKSGQRVDVVKFDN